MTPTTVDSNQDPPPIVPIRLRFLRTGLLSGEELWGFQVVLTWDRSRICQGRWEVWCKFLKMFCQHSLLTRQTTRTSTRMHMHTPAHPHTQTHTRIYSNTRAKTHTHIHAHIHLCLHIPHARKHPNTHTYAHIHAARAAHAVPAA